MKKMMILITALTLSLGLFAQDTTNKKMNKKMDQKMCMIKGGIMMKDGKMMMMENGKSMIMAKDVTLDNGTMVMMDGTVK